MPAASDAGMRRSRSCRLLSLGSVGVGEPARRTLARRRRRLAPRRRIGGSRAPISSRRVAHQRQVARQDAVASVTVRGSDTQHRRVAVERGHVLEGREPHRFGHLCPQQLGYRCPQLIMVAHLHLHSLPSIVVHTIVHIDVDNSNLLEERDASRLCGCPHGPSRPPRAV